MDWNRSCDHVRKGLCLSRRGVDHRGRLPCRGLHPPCLPFESPNNVRAPMSILLMCSCVQVGVIAHGRMQLSSSNSRVVLAGKPDQWYADYLMQPARDYTMPDGEGFSNTYPFVDPPNGGPLSVLHQVKRGRSGKLAAKGATPMLQQQPDSSTRQKLWCIGAGCEEHNADNLKVATENNPKYNWKKLNPPSGGVVKEVKEAIDAYQKDVDLDKKIFKGTVTNDFAVPPAQARTTILCGIDAGCEDDIDSELNIAQKVDKDTVMADLPDFPASDTIDEVWKAMDDKRKDARLTDRKRRGVHAG